MNSEGGQNREKILEESRKRMLENEGLPEDLYERPREEQLRIVNERIADVVGVFFGYEVHSSKDPKAAEGKKQMKDLLMALGMAREEIKKK